MIDVSGRALLTGRDRAVDQVGQWREGIDQRLGQASLRPPAFPAATQPADAEDEQRDGDRREQRGEGQAVRQQPAGGVAVDVEDPHDRATCGWSRTVARIAPGPSVGPDQPPRSSNRTGWTSSTRTRRGAATSARTSPRRTNRRPPSLMLWSRPARAQPPIVDGVKWTFVAARISAASARVIQSVGAGHRGQSPTEARRCRPTSRPSSSGRLRLGASSSVSLVGRPRRTPPSRRVLARRRRAVGRRLRRRRRGRRASLLLRPAGSLEVDRRRR